MRLDKTMPHTSVEGIPGVQYQQDARYFNAGGAEMIVTYELRDGELYSTVTQAPPDPADAEPADGDGPSLETMHWKKLKTLLEVAGGEWSTREAAISFLRGE